VTAPVDHDLAARTAAALMAQLGGGPGKDARIPPDEGLHALARAYTELARSVAEAPLAIYVTISAAREYASAVGLHGEDERARRALTLEMLGARPSPSDPTQWRRRRSGGADITARVTIEGPLAIVTHVSVRGGRRG
jgi:hypothetical protein